MSSVVFYKFINEKEPSRISFDGTGISVFELKRDIIKQSQLGDGTDFDLVLYHQGTRDEYTDDTTIVPRSSQVEAKRVHAAKPGQGRAARYVSGKMPTLAKNAYRAESSSLQPKSEGSKGVAAPVAAPAGYDESQTEEERIAAMMRAGSTQWEQEKQKMASATPVFFGRPGARPAQPPTAENSAPPPPGYLCHRCLQKGHYIQSCPTNGDPTFDQRRRVKRITGIPKSLMQTVEDDEETEDDGLSDDKKTATIMVDVDGKRVRAVPDKASWAQYTAKNEASAAKKDDESQGSEELRERGLECPIDKRLFNNPVKTPCCSKTYCFDCIESALLDTDLVCPGCATEGVLLDNLEPDAETSAKLRAFEEEKKKQKATASSKGAAADKAEEPTTASSDPASTNEKPTDEDTTDLDSSGNARSTTAPSEPSKKRPADGELPNDRQGSAPVGMERSKSQTSEAPKSPRSNNGVPLNAPTGPAADRHKMNGNMGFPMGNFPMQMQMNPNMMNPMMNPMMGFMGFPNQFSSMMGMNMPQMNNGMNGGGAWPAGQNMNMNMNMNMNNNNNGMAGVPTGPRAQQNNVKPGGAAFNAHPSFNADGPYQRNPVNPHRQNKQRRVRQADYKEL